MDGVRSLNVLGIRHATDKSSVWHDYLRHYEEQFLQLKHQEFNLIEIGAANGASLHMWEQFFPRARIIGVDILEACRRHAGGRISIEIGSQDDPAFLDRLCETYPPRIVIDDGSHLAKHILVTFEHVFPKVLPNGWYVIEDLEISGGRDEVQITPQEHLAAVAKALIDGMGALASDKPASRVAKMVDKIEFVRSAVMIRKHDPDATQRAWSVTEQAAEQTGNRQNWYYLARTLERGEPPERAKAAILKALELGPKDYRYHWFHGVILARQGNIGGAVQSVTAAIEFGPTEGPDHEALLKHLNGLKERQHSQMKSQ